MTDAHHMPPIGPLTKETARLLQRGDVVRSISSGHVGTVSYLRSSSGVTLLGVLWPIHRYLSELRFEDIAFVVRPGVWTPWSGGENPVPGMRVELRFRDGLRINFAGRSDSWCWIHTNSRGGDIAAYKVIPEGEQPAADPASDPVDAFKTVLDRHTDRVAAPGRYRVFREGGRIIYEDLADLDVGDTVIGPYSHDKGVIRYVAHGVAAVEFPSDFRAIALDDLGRA